jgi:hypothetical protein
MKELYNLEDDKIYDYFNFKNTIRNWNDFCQPKFHKNSINEIKMIDIDQHAKGSYLKGFDFLSNDNFKFAYLEQYEDNFRKFLEECERLETINLNVNFNSFWGGIANKFMETVYEEVPKVLTVIQGNDLHSSFYNNDKIFNEEKLCNYLWFYSDLYANKKTVLFLPILYKQSPMAIKQFFGINNNHDPANEEIYNYYYTSLAGANLQSFYIPTRSKAFKASTNIYNLLHNNFLNFYETDAIMATDIQREIAVDGKVCSQNGFMFNFSRNTVDHTFSWKKLYTNAEKFNKFSSSILHGFNEKHFMLGEKIDSFLKSHSAFNYTSSDKMQIPLCYPRKIYTDKSEVFLPNLSLMCNYRPFTEYPLSYINNIPTYLKENDIKVRKYLNTFDVSKYVESKDKIEEFYSLLDTYEKFMDDSMYSEDDDGGSD